MNNNDDDQHNYKTVISGDDVARQRFRRIQPEVFEQSTTTTTTTTISKECNSTVNEMTTTQLEKGPMTRINLVEGPRSAFARLFPDRYRQEQEEFERKQRSKSSDSQRYNFDRDNLRTFTNDDQHVRETVRKSHQVTFGDHESNDLKSRTKSEPQIHDTTHRYYNVSSSNGTRNENVSRIPLNYDPEPEIIYRDNPDKLIYVQKVGVRYLKPPTPPPPGPLVIREIQATPPQEPPPLVVSTTPPLIPRTPSPLIVREQPPIPPEHQPTKVITKTLPAPAARPRRVIIKRMPPLPAKPRPVIIEKWLPYKSPPERPILYERAEHVEQSRPAQRNVILQYEPAHVRVEQEIQNVGCFRVDPDAYRAQFGPSLRRTNSIRRVLEDIGCNPDLITSTGYNAALSHCDYPQHGQPNTTCFTDQQLTELIGSPSTATKYQSSHYDTPSSIYRSRNQTIYSNS